jgi:hypothetical protein
MRDGWRQPESYSDPKVGFQEVIPSHFASILSIYLRYQQMLGISVVRWFLFIFVQ